jgi:hypothetical protein
VARQSGLDLLIALLNGIAEHAFEAGARVPSASGDESACNDDHAYGNVD